MRERVLKRLLTVCEIGVRVQKKYEMTSYVPVDVDGSGSEAGERDDGLSADVEFVAVFTAVPSGTTEQPPPYCSTFASSTTTYYDTLSDSDFYADSDNDSDDSLGEFVTRARYTSVFLPLYAISSPVVVTGPSFSSHRSDSIKGVSIFIGRRMRAHGNECLHTYCSLL